MFLFCSRCPFHWPPFTLFTYGLPPCLLNLIPSIHRHLFTKRTYHVFLTPRRAHPTTSARPTPFHCSGLVGFVIARILFSGQHALAGDHYSLHLPIFTFFRQPSFTTQMQASGLSMPGSAA